MDKSTKPAKQQHFRNESQCNSKRVPVEDCQDNSAHMCRDDTLFLPKIQQKSLKQHDSPQQKRQANKFQEKLAAVKKSNKASSSRSSASLLEKINRIKLTNIKQPLLNDSCLEEEAGSISYAQQLSFQQANNKSSKVRKTRNRDKQRERIHTEGVLIDGCGNYDYQALHRRVSKADHAKLRPSDTFDNPQESHEEESSFSHSEIVSMTTLQNRLNFEEGSEEQQSELFNREMLQGRKKNGVHRKNLFAKNRGKPDAFFVAKEARNSIDDDTMINFKKKIELNKQYIKQEMRRKNQESQSKVYLKSPAGLVMSSKKNKRVNSSKMLEAHNSVERVNKNTLEAPLKRKSNRSNDIGKRHNVVAKSKESLTIGTIQKDKNLSKQKLLIQKGHNSPHKNKQSQSQSQDLIASPNNPQNDNKGKNEALFSELQSLLSEKPISEKDQRKMDQNKFQSLFQKLKRLKKQNSCPSSEGFLYSESIPQQLQRLHKKQISRLRNNEEQNYCTSSGRSAAKLKRETNYNDWNKLEMTSSTSQIQYRRSSFEEELQKVSEYADRNDASIEKYLNTRQQLLRYGFQVFGCKRSA